MSNAAKLLRQMRDNPAGDWRLQQLETLAKAHGMTVRKPGGSHAVFQHPRSATALTVPARKPIKPVYVRLFVAMIDEIEGKA